MWDEDCLDGSGVERVVVHVQAADGGEDEGRGGWVEVEREQGLQVRQPAVEVGPDEGRLERHELREERREIQRIAAAAVRVRRRWPVRDGGLRLGQHGGELDAAVRRGARGSLLRRVACADVGVEDGEELLAVLEERKSAGEGEEEGQELEEEEGEGQEGAGPGEGAVRVVYKARREVEDGVPLEADGDRGGLQEAGEGECHLDDGEGEAVGEGEEEAGAQEEVAEEEEGVGGVRLREGEGEEEDGGAAPEVAGVGIGSADRGIVEGELLGEQFAGFQ